MKRSPYFWLLLAALAILVIALVVVRYEGAADDGEDSILSRLSWGIVFAVLAIGPAFMAELVMRALVPASKAARERRRRKKALDTAGKTKRRAEKRIKAIADEHERHKYWSARIQGRYDKIWKQAHAKFGHASQTATLSTRPSP